MRWKLSALDVIIGLMAFAIFEALFFQNMRVDLKGHLRFIEVYVASGEPLPGNSLYYLLTWAGAGFSGDHGMLCVSATAVLSVAVMAKFSLAREHVTDRMDFGGRRWAQRWALASVCLLMVAFSIPAGHYYLGSFPPTTWHNSTMIACMPTVVGAYMLALAQFRAPRWPKHVGMGVLMAVSVWFKPSFFFIFVVAYPLMMLVVHRLSRAVFWAIVSMIPGVLMVAVVYLTVYIASGEVPKGEGGVEVAPFAVWRLFTPDLLLSLARSVVFPVSVLTLGGRQLWRDQGVRLAVVLMAGAVACFALFAEMGERRAHGNFIWQCYMCNFVLFLACLKCMIQRVQQGIYDWRTATMHMAFLAHVASGMVYLKTMLWSVSPLI